MSRKSCVLRLSESSLEIGAIVPADWCIWLSAFRETSSATLGRREAGRLRLTGALGVSGDGVSVWSDGSDPCCVPESATGPSIVDFTTTGCGSSAASIGGGRGPRGESRTESCVGGTKSARAPVAIGVVGALPGSTLGGGKRSICCARSRFGRANSGDGGETRAREASYIDVGTFAPPRVGLLLHLRRAAGPAGRPILLARAPHRRERGPRGSAGA